MKRSRVLITGLSGFTGKYLKNKLLSSGHEVFGLSLDKSMQADQSDSEYSCNLEDTDNLEKILRTVRPDSIIHLAALSFVGHLPTEDFYKVNTIGTHNLLNVAISAQIPIRKIILASTANIYGNAAFENIDEKTVPAPINHYSMSKLSMEHIAKTFSHRFPIIITRPFNYTGTGQSDKFLIPKIVSHFKNQQKVIRLGNTHISRDISNVNDVAEVYLRLVERVETSCTLNICSGQSTSVDEVLNVLNALAGYKIEVQIDPQLVRQNEILKLTGSPTFMKALVGDFKFKTLSETVTEMFHA